MKRFAKIAAAVGIVAAVLAAAFWLPTGPEKSPVSAAKTAFQTQAQTAASFDSAEAFLRKNLETQSAPRSPSQAAPPQPAVAPATTAAALQTTFAPASSITTQATTKPATTTGVRTFPTFPAPVKPTTAQPGAAATTITTTTTTATTTSTAQAPALGCTLSVRCDTLLGHMDQLKPEKAAIVPANGVVLPSTALAFNPGETVFDALLRAAKSQKMQLEFTNVPLYHSAYIDGIANIYEFDCGPLSGWMYRVNGVFPGYGCSKYPLRQGDVVEWIYTCDQGADIGGGVSQKG